MPIASENSFLSLNIRYSQIPENAELFKKFDRNRDGVLTKEEYTLGLESSNLPLSVVQEVLGNYEKMDRDKSGVIELQEF